MKLALADDTMLGRNVAERLAAAPPTALFAEEVVEWQPEASTGEGAGGESVPDAIAAGR